MHRRNKRKRLLRLIYLLIFLVVVVGFLFYLFSGFTKGNTSIKSPLGNKRMEVSPTPDAVVLPENSPGLTAAVSEALQGTYGTYGIVIKNLTTGESYYQHENDTFKSGSLYKLWLMAVVYHHIQDHTLSLEDTLSKDVTDLTKEFNVAPDPTEQTSGLLTLSVADALSQTVTISDNNAALLLTDKVGVKAISQFLNQYGFTHSIVGQTDTPPLTNALDIASFLEKLYKGQLANKENTEAMIGLLKQQRLNDKLPKYLPDGIEIAHKTGELDSVTHDAGIVYTPQGNYIIVILSDSDSPDLAKERIALVSKDVYTYFTNSPSPTGGE